MLALEIHKKIPILHDNNNFYTSIVYAHKKFYFCDPCKYQIIEYCQDFKQLACYKVKRRYSSLCYSKEKNCFFAITKDNCNKVYQLNPCFQEEDCMHIDVGCCVLFSGISTLDSMLYLACTNHIITVPLCKNKACVFIKAKDCFTSVCAHPCYLLTSSKPCCGSTFKVYDYCRNILLSTCLPDDFCIQDITYDGCYIYILVSKCHCYNFVLKCTLSTHCHGDTPEKSCTNIIESIALIETSLSHILNAEGEKLQKILAISDDPDKILEVNDAINHTITNITHLEHVLYAKLDTAKNICTKDSK